MLVGTIKAIFVFSVLTFDPDPGFSDVNDGKVALNILLANIIEGESHRSAVSPSGMVYKFCLRKKTSEDLRCKQILSSMLSSSPQTCLLKNMYEFAQCKCHLVLVNLIH